MTAVADSAADPRYKRLEAEIKRHREAPHALIEVLHVAQEAFGHLDQGLLALIARRLKLPPSRVFGVATFYHFFTLTPRGQHQCVVCTGTACYVKGSAALLAAAVQLAHIQPGETTADGRLSITSARCLGACGSAPVAVLDGEIFGHESAANVQARLGQWLANEST